jgi:hypothetical protein
MREKRKTRPRGAGRSLASVWSPYRVWCTAAGGHAATLKGRNERAAMRLAQQAGMLAKPKNELQSD